tara:strand:- start:481 stop:978 length:498 start_codon:yes stop_codon:yes gene_type:complete
MWTIIKFDRKNIGILKEDFKKKLGKDVTIYSPKLLIQKYKKNKSFNKEFNLLGDYLFCFHRDFKNPETLNLLKFTRGLKYFLGGFNESQDEIEKFIKKCKESENAKGYLTQNFFDICKNSNYKFTSGPFSEKIFKIINLQKNKINILLGNIRTTIKNEEFSFTPL